MQSDLGFLKRDCHRMMRIMWGDDKRGNNRAYGYLHRMLGGDIHFSQIRYRHRLVEIQDLLMGRMARHGYDYQTGERLRVPTRGPATSPKKSVSMLKVLRKLVKSTYYRLVLHFRKYAINTRTS